jgi:hypothetical protein
VNNKHSDGFKTNVGQIIVSTNGSSTGNTKPTPTTDDNSSNRRDVMQAHGFRKFDTTCKLSSEFFAIVKLVLYIIQTHR